MIKDLVFAVVTHLSIFKALHTTICTTDTNELKYSAGSQ